MVNGVSVIIPVKPPEPYLPTLLSRLHKALMYIPHEVLVQTEKGLSYAVKCGVEKAKYPIVAVLDADGSHPPEILPLMLKKIDEGFDIVVGSRYIRGGISYDSVFRQLISRLYCWFARVMLKIKIRNNMSGFIVAKRKVMHESLIYCIGFKFGLELMSNPKYKVCEVPITFYRRKAGNPKSGLLEGLRILYLIFKLWSRQI